MPSDLIRAFDEAAATYDAVDVEFFTPMGAELVRRAGIRPGDHVLDVGCGRGAVLVPAAAAAGPDGRVTGIDLAPAMVELTARELSGLTTVSLTVGDAQRPEFAPGSFDVVTAGQVLFFLPDPPAALRAYRELLRPGGRLAFSSFAAHDPRYTRAVKAVSQFATGLVNRQPPGLSTFQDERSIRAALAEAGYGPVTVTEGVVVSRFRDIGHWMRWVASHAGRQVLNHIPQEVLPRATAAAEAELEGSRADDGGLRLTTTVRYTVAARDA
ncbi:class I SAM-dependent methyltransferase [Nucisporomicrobium flavum]|uniref:class I SAM-dependent methyltransferase n=1 Tax=Nucisporomicrobium flavum TaxID=2785915 RepID=UPI003C2EC478